jgi:hypothetical protein
VAILRRCRTTGCPLFVSADFDIPMLKATHWFQRSSSASVDQLRPRRRPFGKRHFTAAIASLTASGGHGSYPTPQRETINELYGGRITFPGDPVVMAAVPLAMASERRSITRDQSPNGG